MKKIRLACYKTPWQAKLKYWVNWLISLRTLSPYSHVEFWTADDTPFTRHYNVSGSLSTQYLGTMWASTMRGEDNGTVKRDASGVLKHPKNWHYIEIEIDDFDYEYFLAILDLEVQHNKGYAKWDILKFISPIHFNDSERNICSELCNNMLVLIDVLTGKGIISPGKLVKKLTKLGYTIKELK